MNTKKPRQKFISFAAPAVIVQQLEALARATGEGRSALIKRLISEAHSGLRGELEHRAANEIKMFNANRAAAGLDPL